MVPRCYEIKEDLSLPQEVEILFLPGYLPMSRIYEWLIMVEANDYDIFEEICEEATAWFFNHKYVLENLLNIEMLNTLQIVWLYKNISFVKVDSIIYEWNK